MKQTQLFLKVKSVYFVKIPDGEWLNLALVRSVEVEESLDERDALTVNVLVRLVWENGFSKAYSGAKAAAILEALTETAYIDKSDVGATA